MKHSINRYDLILGFRNIQEKLEKAQCSNFSSMYFWEKRHAKCLEIIGKFFSQLYTGSRRKSCLFIETTLIHLKIYTRYNILPSYFMKKESTISEIKVIFFLLWQNLKWQKISFWNWDFLFVICQWEICCHLNTIQQGLSLSFYRR